MTNLVFLTILLYCANLINTYSVNDWKNELFPFISGRESLLKVDGGQEAVVNEFPFTALISSLGSTEIRLCGGSVIANKYILTYASCFHSDTTGGRLNHTFTIILGAHNIHNQSSTTDVAYFAKEIFIHPAFNWTTKLNDVAIIETTEIIQYTPAIQPICLSPTEDIKVGTTLQIAGWGLKKGPFELTNILQKTNITVECDNYCKYYNVDYDKSMFCATGNNTGFCQRDNGGAAFVAVNATYFIQYGIISSGDFCVKPVEPGYYTDVWNVKQWIQYITDSCLC